MRRIILSDTHLGSKRALLRHPEVRERLRPHMAWADELVIAGDLMSMTTHPLDRCVAEARPLLEMIDELVPQVRYLPGNHDWPLGAAGIEDVRWRRAAGLDVAPGRLPYTEAVLGALLPRASLQAYHPVLDLDVCRVLHGHQLVGVFQPSLAGPTDTIFGSLLQMQFMHANDGVHPDLQDLLTLWQRQGSMPRVPGAPALVPVDALLGALEAALEQMGVPAGHVVFGHIHQTVDGVQQGPYVLHNSGCWITDAYVLDNDPEPHRSWPGTVLAWDEDGPRLLRLLDDLTRSDLHELAT